jgi:hypothetical protein
MQRVGAGIAALALGLPGAQPALAQGQAQAFSGPALGAQVGAPEAGGFVLKVNSELVLTNVVARDTKTGELVRGLKQSDFTVYENGKQQQIATFDFENVEMATPLNEATVSGLAAGASRGGGAA